MSYKVVACHGTPDRAVIGQRPPDFEAAMWMLGISIPAPTRTFEFLLDPQRGNQLAEMYTEGALIMREDLLSAFEEAGVDNLQAFPVAIVDPRTGQRHEAYRLVNVVGKARAVDEEASDRLDTAPGHLADSVFNTLAIDESSVPDLLMFRLAESLRTVLVHESVVARIDSRTFPGMTFYDPGEWV